MLTQYCCLCGKKIELAVLCCSLQPCSPGITHSAVAMWPLCPPVNWMGLLYKVGFICVHVCMRRCVPVWPEERGRGRAP